LFYAVHRQQADADALVLYELYRDRAAWEAHMALPAVQAVLQQFDTLLAQPPRLVFCDPLAWSGMQALPELMPG
jgi:quinol monooxygenase YgiN